MGVTGSASVFPALMQSWKMFLAAEQPKVSYLSTNVVTRMRSLDVPRQNWFVPMMKCFLVGTLAIPGAPDYAPVSISAPLSRHCLSPNATRQHLLLKPPCWLRVGGLSRVCFTTVSCPASLGINGCMSGPSLITILWMEQHQSIVNASIVLGVPGGQAVFLVSSKICKWFTVTSDPSSFCRCWFVACKVCRSVSRLLGHRWSYFWKVNKSWRPLA